MTRIVTRLGFLVFVTFFYNVAAVRAAADEPEESRVEEVPTSEESNLSPANQVTLRIIKSNLDLPSSQILDKKFWTTTQLDENENFNIYFTHNIEEMAEFVVKELRDAYNNSSDNEEAKDEILELLDSGSDEEIEGDLQYVDTSLYKKIMNQSQFKDEEKAADAWAGLIFVWHNEVDEFHMSQYREALGELFSDAIPALVETIQKTHDQARGDVPGGGAGGGGTAGYAPAYVSRAMIRYLRHKQWRDARNELRREIYSRLSQ